VEWWAKSDEIQSLLKRHCSGLSSEESVAKAYANTHRMGTLLLPRLSRLLTASLTRGLSMRRRAGSMCPTFIQISDVPNQDRDYNAEPVYEVLPQCGIKPYPMPPHGRQGVVPACGCWPAQLNVLLPGPFIPTGLIDKPDSKAYTGLVCVLPNF